MTAMPNLFPDSLQQQMQELYGTRSSQIHRATKNADLIDGTFQTRADAWVVEFATTHVTFSASRCTSAARLAGVDSPAHGAWGAVFKRAQVAGTIERIGFTPRKNGNPAPLYGSLVHSENRT